MKINRKYQIEKTASKDPTRYVLNDPYLDTSEIDKPVLVATDGRMLAVVPVEVLPEDMSGHVPVDAIKELRKDKSGKSEINLNGKVEVVNADKITRFTRPEGTFPNWKQVVPQGGEKFTISFNPEMLLRVAQAVGCEKGKAITLKFKGPLDPIKIETGNGAYGVLMPMKL